MDGVTDMDWHAWHHDYDEPGTPLARRLAAVQTQIRVALDAAPPGPLHAISLCAGQGRDLTADAALTDQYAGMVPAYLVLVCGMFGNMADDDVRRTVGYCTQLCAHGGTVIWTRGRGSRTWCRGSATGSPGTASSRSGCPTRPRAGERARTASPRSRSRSSAAPACSGSPAGPRH
jgi:hypothetical protein